MNKKPKIIACFQARMGSARLPGKVLKKIGDKTIFEFILKRLKFCREIDGIIFATGNLPRNKVLTELAGQLGIPFYVGSEEDIVSRLLGAGHKAKADGIVRILGDSPLFDPVLIDKGVKLFKDNYGRADVVTNFFPPTFPDGLDVDVTSIKTLEKLDTLLSPVYPNSSFHRTWWLSFIFKHPKLFKTLNFRNSSNMSKLRLTLDYPEDLVLIRKICQHFKSKNRVNFGLNDIVTFLDQNKKLLKINQRWADNRIVGGIRSGGYHKLIKKIKVR